MASSSSAPVVGVSESTRSFDEVFGTQREGHDRPSDLGLDPRLDTAIRRFLRAGGREPSLDMVLRQRRLRQLIFTEVRSGTDTARAAFPFTFNPSPASSISCSSSDGWLLARFDEHAPTGHDPDLLIVGDWTGSAERPRNDFWRRQTGIIIELCLQEHVPFRTVHIDLVCGVPPDEFQPSA